MAFNKKAVNGHAVEAKADVGKPAESSIDANEHPAIIREVRQELAGRAEPKQLAQMLMELIAARSDGYTSKNSVAVPSDSFKAIKLRTTPQ